MSSNISEIPTEELLRRRQQQSQQLFLDPATEPEEQPITQIEPVETAQQQPAQETNVRQTSTEDLLRMREQQQAQIGFTQPLETAGFLRSAFESGTRSVISPVLGLPGDFQQMFRSLLENTFRAVEDEDPQTQIPLDQVTPGQRVVNDLQFDLLEKGDLFSAALLNDDDIIQQPIFFPGREDVTRGIEIPTGQFEEPGPIQAGAERVTGTTLQGLILGGPIGAALGFAGATAGELIEAGDLSPRDKGLAQLSIQGILTAGAGIHSIKSPAKTPTQVANLQANKLAAYANNNIQPTVTPFLTAQAETSRLNALGLRTKAGQSLIAKNVNDITRQAGSNIKNFVQERVGPSFREFSNFEVVDPFSKTFLQERVDQQTAVLSDTANKIESGNQVRNTIQTVRKAVRDEAGNLYTAAKEGAEQTRGRAQKTLESAVKLKNELEKAGGAATPARKNLIQRIESIIEEIADPTSDGSYVASEIDGSRMIAIKETLNEISEVDVPIPRLKARIEEISKPFRVEIRETLGQNPDALDAFNNAELMWADQAERFDNPSKVLEARSVDTLPENITKINQPSEFLQFVESIGDTDQGKAAIQTVLKEILRERNKPSDLTFLRELFDIAPEPLKPFIREHAKLINPASQAFQLSTSVDSAALNIAEAINTGKPTRAIADMNQSMKQRSILKQAVKRFDNSSQILSAIDTAYLESFMQSVVDENGQLNAIKMKRLFQNEDFNMVMRDIVGQDGLQFIQDLDTISSSVVDVLDQFPNLKSTPEGSQVRGLMVDLIVGQIAGPAAEALTFAAQQTIPPIVRMLDSRRARNAMQNIANLKGKRSTPQTLNQISRNLAIISETLDRPEQEQEDQ